MNRIDTTLIKNSNSDLNEVADSNELDLKVQLTINSGKVHLWTSKGLLKASFNDRPIRKIMGVPTKLSFEHILQARKVLPDMMYSVRSDTLDIVPRGRGGMMALGTAALSVIPSTMSLFTSGNYIKLARAAGQEARATITVAGQESRATIVQGEQSANRTLSRMGTEVRNSVLVASRETSTLLTQARNDLNRVVDNTGIEARLTADVMATQAAYVINRAGREAEYLFQKAGIEAQRSIQLSGEEVRNSCQFMNEQFSQALVESSNEARGVITHGGNEVKEILMRASSEASAIIREGGAEMAQRSNEVITRALQQVEQFMQGLLPLIESSCSTLISQMAKEAKAVIFDLGEQGRLIVKDLGNEIRVTANGLIEKAMVGQETVIKALGEESRLTVRHLGAELRSTLYQTPYLAGEIGREFAKGFIEGCISALVNQSDTRIQLNNLGHTLEKGVDFIELIKWVTERTVSPDQKFIFYKQLVIHFDDLRHAPNHQEITKMVLFVAITALKDESLVPTRSGILGGMTDWKEELIKVLPRTPQALIREKGEKALDDYLPREVERAQIAPINPLQFELEERALQITRFQTLLELEKGERMAVEQELANASTRTISSQSKSISSINQLQTELVVAQKKNQDTLGKISSLEKSIQYLLSTNYDRNDINDLLEMVRKLKATL